MKKIVLLACIALINLQFAQAQRLETKKSSQELYDFHMKQSRTNKIWAWVVVGTGVGIMVTGLGIAFDDPIMNDEGDDDSIEGVVLSAVGSLSTLFSIPLFIAGAEHKKKARLYLQNANIGFNRESNYIGITLTISF